MKRITFFILLGCALFVFIGPAAGEHAKQNYSIQLIPEAPSDTYNLKINDTITFTIQGQKQDPDSKSLSNVEALRIWWQYNLGILEKVSASKNSITLKAIGPGVTELMATVDIGNQHFSKTVTIIVEK